MGYYALNRRVNHGSFTRLDRKDWIYSKEQIPELVIIQKQDWEKAQQIREARKAKLHSHATGTSCDAPFSFPLRTSGRLALIGLAYCGYCGSKLKNGSYYQHRTGKPCQEQPAFTGRYLCPQKCPARSCYSQNYLESAVFRSAEQILEQIQSIDISEDLHQIYVQKQKKLRQEADMLQKKKQQLRLDISSLEEKIPEAIRGDYFFSAEKLSSILSEKELSFSALQEQEQALLAELRRAEREQNEQTPTKPYLPDWKKEFQNSDTAAKQMLLFHLIEKIIVKDNDITINLKI